MKVILLQDISKLGKKYDVKEVSSGYAQNLLIPKGQAVVATQSAMKKLEAEKAKWDTERKIKEDLLLKNIQDLDGVTLNVSGKANDKGHLFAGLHKEELCKEITSQTRLEVDPSFIKLEHPIKELGDHQVEVSAAGKSVKFTVSVKAS